MKYRSDEFEAIKERVLTDYSDKGWPFAKRWRGRVGFPRLIAESAASLALHLLRDINAGVFRNDPKLRALLDEAREVVEEFHGEIARDNWRRFEDLGPAVQEESK